MLLRDYVSAYGLCHSIEPGTVTHLASSVRALDKWHGKETDLADLSDEFVNRWMTHRLASGIARKTIAGQRASVLTLWRAANEDGLHPTPPRRVKIIKLLAGNPDAWWPDQMAKLLAAAESAHGCFKCGAKRADLLRAWLLTGYYSLLRPCDLCKLMRADVQPDGGLLVIQSKTKYPVARYLPPDAMAAIQLLPDGGKLFPVSAKAMRYWWLWLKKKSGVPGSPKWLRRTGATQCELQQPGSGMQALGHRTPGLAYKFYVDQRQLMKHPPVPPRIG